MIGGRGEGNQQPLRGSRPERELRVSVSSPLLSSPPHPPPHPSQGGQGLGGRSPGLHGNKCGAGTGNGQRPEQAREQDTPPTRAQGAGSAQWAERRAGTRRAQAAVGISALAVLLLLELGHQAELPAAAAFGQIGGRVLRCRGRDADGQSRARAERAAPDALVPAAPLGRWPRVHWGVLRPVKSGFTRITVYFSTFCFSLYNVHSPHDDKAL